MIWIKLPITKNHQSLAAAFSGDVATFGQTSGFDQTFFKAGLEHLHREAVTQTIAEYKSNIILNGNPGIHESEKLLLRSTRETLSQHIST